METETRRLKKGDRMEFGPMPGDRWEPVEVIEDEPEPEVRVRYEDGMESTVKRGLLRAGGVT